MLPGPDLFLQFLHSVVHGVDGPAALIPRFPEKSREIEIGDGADHEKVNVAPRILGSLRDGAEDEGPSDRPGPLPERVAENLREAAEFQEEAAKFGVHRRLRVRAKIDPVPVGFLDRDSHPHEAGGLLLHGPHGDPEPVRHLAEVEAFAGMQQEELQDPRPRGGAEEVPLQVDCFIHTIVYIPHTTSGRGDPGGPASPGRGTAAGGCDHIFLDTPAGARANMPADSPNVARAACGSGPAPRTPGGGCHMLEAEAPVVWAGFEPGDVSSSPACGASVTDYELVAS